jgi:uncharacterized protein YqhQ
MLRRGSTGAGVPGSRRLNARFLWAVLAVEVLTAFLARHVSGPRPLMVAAPLVVALVLLRLTTPSALWRYHGAEHKAVAAHEAGIDMDDTAAVLRCSRVHNRCGTNLVVVMLVAGLFLVRLATVVQIPAFLLVLAAVAELMTLAAGRPRAVLSRLLVGPGRFLQRWLTTAEPTPAEQAVACHALTACLTASGVHSAWKARGMYSGSADELDAVAV